MLIRVVFPSDCLNETHSMHVLNVIIIKNVCPCERHYQIFVKKALKKRKVFLLTWYLLPVTNSQINTYRHNQSTPPWRFSLISSHPSPVLQSSVGWIFLTLKGFIILTLCKRRPTKLEVTMQFRPWSFHKKGSISFLVLPLQMWQHVESCFIYI